MRKRSSYMRASERYDKMTTEQFYFWLRGFFEISEANSLNARQVFIIKEHLDLVARKETANPDDAQFRNIKTVLSC